MSLPSPLDTSSPSDMSSSFSEDDLNDLIAPSFSLLPDKPTQLLWQALLQAKGAYVGMIGLTALAACGDFLPFFLLAQAMIGFMTGNIGAPDLLSYFIFIMISLLAKYGATSWAYLISHKQAFRLQKSLRLDICLIFAIAPVQWCLGQHSGRVKQVLFQDIDQLEQFFAHHAVEIPLAIWVGIMSLLYLGWVDVTVMMAALLPLPVAFAVQYLFVKRAVPFKRQLGDIAGKLDAAVLDYIRTLPAMRLFCRDGQLFQQFKTDLQSYRDLIMQAVGYLIPAWSFFLVCLTANSAILGPLLLYKLEQGHLDLSDVIISLIMGHVLLLPLLKILKFTNEIEDILVSAARILTYLQAGKEQGRPVKAVDANHTIQKNNKNTADNALICHKVNFGYHAEHATLHDISCQIPSGQLTLILGESGSGKTTLGHLLAGVIDPDKGDILEGQSRKNLSATQRQQILTLVSQDSFLFQGTIRENLCLGREESDAALQQALSVAQAWSFIENLPLGLSHQISAQGQSLSGGERQRLCLARALLRQSPILLLDEASAALDMQMEKDFLADWKAAYPDQTKIVITHRLQAALTADHLIFMARGQVVAAGTHRDLLDCSPEYQQNWSLFQQSQNWSLRQKERA